MLFTCSKHYLFVKLPKVVKVYVYLGLTLLIEEFQTSDCFYRFVHSTSSSPVRSYHIPIPWLDNSVHCPRSGLYLLSANVCFTSEYKINVFKFWKK